MIMGSAICWRAIKCSSFKMKEILGMKTMCVQVRNYPRFYTTLSRVCLTSCTNYYRHYKTCDNNSHYATKPSHEKQSNLELQMTRFLDEFKTLDPVVNSVRIKQIRPIVSLIQSIDQVKSDMKSLEEMGTDKIEDKEMKSLCEEEIKTYQDELVNLEHKLATAIIQDEDQFEHCTEVMMEISAGVGGQEAMLFAQEVYEMYIGYGQHRGLDCQTVVFSTSEMGGLRQATLNLSGPDCFSYLKYEGGVHRVQRVPKTERSGRLHTSTVSVAVLPQPKDIEVAVAEKDLKIETKRASGAGGQHVNKTDSAVRMTHIPTGIVVECQEDRSQIKNRSIAMDKLKRLLYEAQFEEQETKCKIKRKVQVGRKTRNEKIRTYNYPQDRITDHRIHKTLYSVAEFMSGGSALHELIDEIRTHDYAFRIDQLLS
uniref:Peptide chain release factor 1-like, mitochondrial n=2 Tax=Cacopsylla melanoneura TaxID=428564 RepID=A0A8D8SUD5_9HEMI